MHNIEVQILPKISIVTPSYNQGKYIEETIQSVLSQNYPNLEYIVIDGGSKDISVDIIKKYEDRIFYWESEPDDGQCEAIKKGFNIATGDIFTWLCSDDLLKPGVLWLVAGFFISNDKLELLYGDTEYLYDDGTRYTKERISYNYKEMLYAFNHIAQPSSFFKKDTYFKIGGLDSKLQFAMDYDLFLRMGEEVSILFAPTLMSSYRIHNKSKTASQAELFKKEWKYVREKILGRNLNLFDKLKWYLYTAKVVLRYYCERGIVKVKYDKKKYDETADKIA